jgi:nitrate reductase NapAB chaperone NapD
MHKSNSQSETDLGVVIDSKSQDDPYNHLDACQGMDGVLVVSQSRVSLGKNRQS